MTRSMKPIRLRLLGKYYLFHYGRVGEAKVLGIHRYKAKEIVVSPRLRGLSRLDVTIHELLHGALDAYIEPLIDRLGTAMANVLWLGGWRNAKYDTLKLGTRADTLGQYRKLHQMLAELIKIAVPHYKAEWVKPIAADLARALYRLGWRKVE